MIVFRRTFLGVVLSALIMIPSFLIMWVVDMGGLGGVMDDDSYPGSLFITPVLAALFSGLAFWVAIYPSALLARWIGSRKGWSLGQAGGMAVMLALAVGVLFGVTGGGIVGAVFYAFYMGVPATVFWIVTARLIPAVKQAGKTLA